MAISVTELKRSFSWRSLARQNDLFLALLIVAVVALMVLPLPPYMLDTLIALNLSMSVILLMVALYITSPLGLSTFPSLLLFTTLFRLSLNIASTRQILLHADAGDIIYTFGNMVVGGDIIVGIVVFLIIAVVQFVVIAKGAERVAEVGARFTLDAMPGKQMSIDADLRAGIIDKDEARGRRSRLERESHLYGAMDGAMKFVKGDAIAGMIIAAVNILAGMTIGTLRRGMDMSHALQTYSVLAVGDALVSQIPSLLVSIAAGVIITRVSNPEFAQGSNLGNEISQQVRAHPRAWMIGSGLIFCLMLVPGFPKLQFLTLAVGAGALGFFLLPARRRYATPGDTPMPSMRRELSDKPAPWLDSADHALTVPVVVQVAPGMEHRLSPQQLEHELAKVRRSFSQDLGVPFPGIVMRRSALLAENRYRVLVNEIPAAHGEIRPQHVLNLDPKEALLRAGVAWAATPVPLPPPGQWVHEKHLAQLNRAGLRHLTLEQAFARHLLHVLQNSAEDLFGIQEAQTLLRRLAEEHPDLEKELLRTVPLPRLTDVLRRLVRERISVRNLRTIAHGLIDWAPREKDTVMLTEYVRTCMSKYISFRFSNGANTLAALVLHPSVEEQLRQSIRQTSAGAMLMLDPATKRQLSRQIHQALAPHTPQHGAVAAVLLTSLEIRPYLRRLTEVELPDLTVLSYQELEPSLQVTPLASITL
ncbi:MAG TPA: type III secretion system export apparatus subunit SctV [Povalibacter sp.]